MSSSSASGLPRTPAENLRLLAPLGALHMALYGLVNHVQLFPSRRLPLTALDTRAPFLVWTIWPYLLLVVPVGVAGITIQGREVFRRAVRAYVVAFALALPFYVFLPTHYPRPAAPGEASVTAIVYRLFIRWDTPEVAFPSGHVIVPVLCAWAACRDGKRWGPALAVLVALALPSILTTKQHYAWDGLGGLACAGIGIALARYPLENVFRIFARRTGPSRGEVG